ncbi:hypothetical protein [Novosphingobium sp. PC22D]|uniref:hypothetical protein n=1 Tax=Novosphingobium sp. PC22D TaxID=1962403 RepID=UPI0011460090|nr:hypothetical protein [Novosphingobium sp. PC22D]
MAIRPLALLAVLGAMALAASCSDRRVIPAPAPTTPPPAAPRPLPTTAPPVDWQDAPITPGDWTWGMVSGQSVARFANGLFAMRCNVSDRTVSLIRAGAPAEEVPMTVITEKSTRTLVARRQPSASPTIEARLGARDPLLDAMAFSRGRFAIASGGQPTLYVPSWPEVSRVIEDCR